MFVLGLHKEGASLKTALLRKNKGKPEIVSLEPELNVKPLYICASGLDSGDTLFRTLPFETSNRKAILEALPFQIESVIPYPNEELIVLPFFEKISKDQTDVTILATKKNSLQNHLDALQTLGIDPHVISCVPAALSRFSHYAGCTEEFLFFFHLGLQKSCYGMLKKGKLAFVQTHSLGYKDFLDAYQKDQTEVEASELDLFAIEQKKMPHLEKLISQFQKDLARIQAYLRNKNESETNAAFLFTGDVDTSFKLIPFLERHLGPSISISVSAQERAYAVPIGLALDALKDDTATIQFRREEYAHPFLIKKRIKHALSYLSICAILSGAALFASQKFIKEREEALAARFHTDLDVFEKSSLAEAAGAWEKSISKQKRFFPYVLNVPKVSDVLAWLSTYPQLKEGIEIKRVHYSLAKHPRIGENPEPYQAKLDLDFTSESPRFAREFHDALMQGDPMIDPQSDIVWNVHQNTYHTSFFLKGAK